MNSVCFERRITVEEADASRIRVRRDLMPALLRLGRELCVTLRGRRFAATIEFDLCQCGGVARPHSHHFLLLRGDPGLRLADRVEIEVSAAPAAR